MANRGVHVPKKNFDRKLQMFRRMTYLTLYGKITVTNSLVILQFIYILTSLSSPGEENMNKMYSVFFMGW